MFNKEPAVVFNGLGEVFKAVIPVLILFEFVQWSDKQIAGLMFLSSVVITFLTTTFTRQQVVPIHVADKQIEIAKASDITTPTAQIIKQAKESV